ncbi:MAG: M48 family metallopeptidase [Bacteroidota bacterium]
MKRVLLLLLVALILQTCKTVPLTGRRQVALIPAAQMNTLSADSYNSMLGEAKVDRTSRNARRVQQVGQQISRAVTKYLRENNLTDRLAGFKWEFNLIDDPAVNAFCMPGGKVAFYSGIMPICETDLGVAVVMGHEVAHAIAKHGNERMTQGLAQQFGGMALQVALADKPAETQALFMQAYGIGTTVGAILPFSRLHETEADELGLIFMAMAGYDPREAPKFWQRMAAAGGAQPPTFLSTHPNHQQRIAKLNELMPKALQYYKN